MANLANEIFSVDFSGALGNPWPLSFGTGNPPFTPPRLDGKGHGIGSLAMGAGTWRGISSGYPGRSGYKADLLGRWKNPGGAGERGVGLLFRLKDYANTLSARITSKGAANPVLELLKIVGGVETVLGSYSGPGLGSSALLSGVTWRARVEDLEDGDTVVRVYTNSQGVNGDGDLRITYTGDLSTFRGNYGVGVELTTLVYNDDVKVSGLAVYDFADEWSAPAPSPEGLGTGWQAEIGETLYDVTSDGSDALEPGGVGALEGLSPPVFLEEVRQGYGPSGNLCTLKTAGIFSGGIVNPNTRVVVFHDGTAVFRGRVVKGKQVGSASSEVQSWVCRDAFWQARDVVLEEDDGSGTLAFNVSDEQSDLYNPDRLDMTLGDVLEFLFDRYVDDEYGLRFYGAAPPTGTPYVSGELAALSAVVPNLTVSNNFAAAVDQVLAFMPRYQVWIDPADQVWHFRDVLSLSPETVSFDSEWAEVEIEPDPSRSYTRVLYRGAKKAEGDDSTLEFSTAASTLEPAWTAAQEENFDPDKRTRDHWTMKILFAGNYGLPLPVGVPQGTLCYVDVAASENLDPDDLRGGISGGLDAFPRFVTGNTSTRIFLGAPIYPTIPSPGDTIVVSLLDDEARRDLSAQGVGSVYLLPPIEICPGFGGAYAAGVRQGGFCGDARVEFTKDGRVYSQKYAAKMHFASALASGAGQCRPSVELAEKPKPPVGLINYLPPPGGSPPLSSCEKGGTQPAAMPQVGVKFTVRPFEATAPKIVLPAEGFSGEAFESWGVERTFVFDDAEYTDDSMTAGLTPAAQAILDVYSQRTYFFSVRLGTPWKAQAPQLPGPPDPVSRWGSLFRSVRLSSSRRSMPDYEAPNAYAAFEIVWNIRRRQTTIRAGTAAGWLAMDARVLTKQLREAAVEKKIAESIRTLEDFRNRLTEKENAVAQQPAGMIPGCQVEIIDEQNRRVVAAPKKFDDDQQNLSQVASRATAIEDLLLGEDSVNPGSPVEVDGVPSGYPVPGQNAVLGQPIADPRIPGGGAPDSVVNGGTSRYGGVPGVDEGSFGPVPVHVFRRGGLAFRSKTNANGNVVGLEAAALGPDGSIPVSGWATIEKPKDVLSIFSKPPERLAGGDSIVGRMVRTDDSLLDAIGRVREPVEGLPVAPGTVTPDHPEGTPPDLSSILRTPGASEFFDVVPESWDDPGGPVYAGPTNGRADAEMTWRVLVPENVLVSVVDVGFGNGMNGGAWDLDASGPGGTVPYLTNGYVVHKQIHGNDLEADVRQPFPPVLGGQADPTNPFGAGACSPSFNPAGPSGLAWEVAVPDGVVGKPWVEVVVTEDPVNPSPPGLTADFDSEIAYQASPWGTPSAGPSGSITTDGTGQTTGRFMGPADAVPPGLRKVSGSVTNPANGTSGGPRISGIGIDLSIVEGGYLLRLGEGLGIDEVLQTGDVAEVENLEILESAALVVLKGLEERVGIHDGVSLEVNPPVAVEEAVSIQDGVVLLVV